MHMNRVKDTLFEERMNRATSGHQATTHVSAARDLSLSICTCAQSTVL